MTTWAKGIFLNIAFEFSLLANTYRIGHTKYQHRTIFNETTKRAIVSSTNGSLPWSNRPHNTWTCTQTLTPTKCKYSFFFLLRFRFYWGQCNWILGSRNEQCRSGLHEFSLFVKASSARCRKKGELCRDYEVVQWLWRSISKSIWVRWNNCWSNENHFDFSVGYT